MTKRKPKRDPNALTPKQRALVLEYLKDKNATAAAERAGYSKASAYVIGPRVMGIPKVKAFLEAKLKDLEDKLSFTAKDVMEALYAQGTLDRTLIYNEDRTLKPFKEWPLVARQMLEKFKVQELFDGEGRDREKAAEILDVALSPRTPAMLGLIRIMKGEKINHAGPDGTGPIIVKWEGEE